MKRSTLVLAGVAALAAYMLTRKASAATGGRGWVKVNNPDGSVSVVRGWFDPAAKVTYPDGRTETLDPIPSVYDDANQYPGPIGPGYFN